MGRRRSALALTTAATMLVLCAAVFLEHGSPDVPATIVVAVAYSAVALMPLRLPQGDTVFGVVGVIVAAVALLPPSVVVGGALVGSVLTLLFMSREQPWRSGIMEALRQPMIAAATVLAYPYLPSLAAAPEPLGAIPWAVVAAALLYVALDLVTGSLDAMVVNRTAAGDVALGLTRLVGGMYLALASVGVALAIVYPTMGLIGGVVLVTLMALMKLSFGMYIRARAAYPKTVGVLARLAEIEMQEAHGHSERVAELAIAVGKRLRLGNKAVEQLGLAALLHDIGKVKTGILHDDGEHAQVGAEILEQIEFLRELAPIVRGHHATTVDQIESDEDLLAHIVYAVSWYDLRVQERSGPDVLAEMMDQQDTRFDRRVIVALSRVS